MRDFLEKNNNKITEAQARDIIDRCLKVLYYRDGRAYDKVKINKIKILVKLFNLFLSNSIQLQ